MGFYEEFNKYYDSIFPTGKPQLEFISRRINGKNVLDIACGTGNYSIPLAEGGFNVSAIDLDEGMIEALNLKAKKLGVEVKAIAGDMKNLKGNFENSSFETAFCIGNSLVHLTTKEEILQVLREVFSLLKKSGKLILQIINYDRILKYDVKNLPTIENKEEEISLVRNYEYRDGLIYFNTELIIQKEEKIYQSSVALYPLKSDELIEMLKDVGFKVEELYGSFKEEPHSDQSYGTIIVAGI